MQFFKHSNIMALCLLLFMGVIAVTSIREDSVTTDESPHITAGYSYLKLHDMRLNPEHPPLVKDLAAIPLLFQKIHFPTNEVAWTSMINAQWDLGPQFLYRSGNDPDKIIFWGRIGPILITLLFGWFVFRWARELFGERWALFTLALFVFSPNIMAHGRLVTTDIPAAFAFFAAIYYYLKLLKNPSWKNLVIAGVVFAMAQLTKFSLVLLIGFLPAITLVWIIVNKQNTRNPNAQTPGFQKLGSYWSLVIGIWSFIIGLSKSLWLWIFRFLVILAITALIVLPVYQFHVANYPPEKQAADIQHILGNSRFPLLTHALVWMSDKPVLRAYAQYILGVSMVFMRVAGGNTTYFLGQVSNHAWWYYFPVAYILKEPLPILLLIFFGLLIFFKGFFRRIKISFTISQIRNNFDEIAMLAFVVFYWVISITGNLNIGVRHVLPSFPFIYLLITGQMKRWNLLKANRIKMLCIAILLVWYIGGFARIYPHFLAYFNEFAGGPNGGYRYVVDSNLDWGQDLRRLAKFVEEKHIDKIKVDYFGGGDIAYYLGGKAENWHADNGPTTGWIAVSATFIQTSRAYPAASYAWLDAYEPVEKIGYSIFVYHVEK